jgi:acetoin utilization protein AcuB
MSKPIPTIQKFMTTQPHSIGQEQTMATAHGIMREFHCRHLPVLTGGKLVGLLSDRDLSLLETLRDVDPKKVLVEDAMTADPYTVSPDTALDEVVAAMAEHKYGCAVVMQNNKLVGIFTTVDACRAFAEMLHGRLAK